MLSLLRVEICFRSVGWPVPSKCRVDIPYPMGESVICSVLPMSSTEGERSLSLMDTALPSLDFEFSLLQTRPLLKSPVASIFSIVFFIAFFFGCSLLIFMPSLLGELFSLRFALDFLRSICFSFCCRLTLY